MDTLTLGNTLIMRSYTQWLNRIRVYGTIGNLATWTRYSGVNPEVNITGWDQGTEKFWDNFYPNVRTYTLGLQFNF